MKYIGPSKGEGVPICHKQKQSAQYAVNKKVNCFDISSVKAFDTLFAEKSIII